MAARKICVVTGGRAEYGLLYWLMKEIEADEDLALQLVVTGTHLAPAFGETYKLIEADGFTIDAHVDIEIGDDTPAGISRSLGLSVMGIAKAFKDLRPDITVLLGDRFEIFGAAQAAMISRVPIAHIHGGEITEGAMDDAMRHAISKLAHLHFAAADDYRLRIIQLGEEPERVFNVGAIGVDCIQRMNLMPQSELESELGLPTNGRYFLVTYHPETLSSIDPSDQVREMLAALDQFPAVTVVLTGVNADPGHGVITHILSDYTERNKGRVIPSQTMGQLRYLSAMKFCAAVIGNSSSGIVEAPALGVPTVNIGARQKGRLRAPSVIDCAGYTKDIATAVQRAGNTEFRKSLKHMKTPFGKGGAAQNIKRHLKTVDLRTLCRKQFYNIAFESVLS